ncbi:MAG: aldo/keto reductase [Bryobacterales bacterium]|nr:aldo/keto reductase [Bryobacterales bacterium]
MQRKRLGQTDLEVSVLGFGAAPLGDEYGVIDEGEAEHAVQFAIDCGINFFDTAPYYGRTLSEERLGKALGGRRQEVLIATKCSRYGLNDFDFSAKRVEESIDESLRRLRTDHVDLYQIHDIEFGDLRQVIEEAVPAARKVQQAGKARCIGITGLQLKALRRVAEAAPVDTILSYARYNLLARDLDDLMTPFAKERGIGLINASPLHLRILTPQGAPEWHPASPEVKEIGRKVVELCEARGKPAPKAALRFCLDHPYISTTLVGLATVEQVRQNLEIFDETNDPELLAEIEDLAAPVLHHIWPSGHPENQDYPDPMEGKRKE